MRFDTKLLHAAQPPDAATGAVNPPIYLSSTFAQSAPNRTKGYVYGRTSNPTRTVLESVLAELEVGKRGLAFASGLGALTTFLEELPSGHRIVAGSDLYGGTWRLFDHHHRQFGIVVEYVDTADAEAFATALERAPADFVYVETPTNPLMHVADLARLGSIARRHRARLVVDNTFASPALQRPLELGADLVLHSTTKYLGGHSDVLGGALVARDRKFGDRLAWLQNAVGAVPSPVDSFLVLRGIRTLGVRMRRHSEGGMAVATALSESRRVVAVHYPGLPDHPQHAVARRQMDGFGGMLSVELRGGGAAARRFLRGLRVFTLAESLGGVESLADHPASMTHASVPPAEREARGITDGLVRLSVGIEDPLDLVEDVRRALGGV
ncbi:MAG TPA: PLP-dependent aspartate aminotransferase family protein [Thermoplasmata archaeon]|nr:PLP-dependent aspartate aminotransferase family protein [Thermoplasmata archaeon]